LSPHSPLPAFHLVGLPVGLGLDIEQLRTLVGHPSGSEEDSDSMEIDKAEEAPTDSSPEQYALSRCVTLKKRDYDSMTREEIVRAKDIVLVAQKRRIELQKRVRELGNLLQAADRIQTSTMEVLSLSLEQDCNHDS
jgi:hypothetical protein